MEQVSAVLLILVGLAVGGFWLTKSIRFIGEKNFGNVERFRAYQRTIGSGWHLVIWPIETVVENTYRQVLIDVPKVVITTRDNIRAEVDVNVRGRIVDPYRSQYAAVGLKRNIQFLVVNVCNDEVPKLTGNKLLSGSGRAQVRGAIRVAMDDEGAAWGFDTDRVGIDGLVLTGRVHQAYEEKAAASQLATARRREAGGVVGAFKVILNQLGGKEVLAKEVLELETYRQAGVSGGLLGAALTAWLRGGPRAEEENDDWDF